MQPMQPKQAMQIMHLMQLQTCNPHVLRDLASNCDQCVPESLNNILSYVTASVVVIATGRQSRSVIYVNMISDKHSKKRKRKYNKKEETAIKKVKRS